MTLAQSLSSGAVLNMGSSVTHGRRGSIHHGFRYHVDFLLFAPEVVRPPLFMSKNGLNLISYHDRDHGGRRGNGRGPSWAWERLVEAGLKRRPGMVLALLTQPRFLWYWFNPISFWMVIEGDDVISVIAEVNNTFGHRHSYLCRTGDFGPITAASAISLVKNFHVSPFQNVKGNYKFRFNFRPDRIAIRILQIDGNEGLDAAMSGRLTTLTPLHILWNCLRRPGGPIRILALIHWNALRLKLKGASYRRLPAPPENEITQ